MNDEENVTGNPTQQSIAKAAGVSIASVSKVLNNRSGVSDENRRRILEVAEQFGYLSPTTRTRRKAGIDNAVLIVPAAYYSNSQFYADIIEAALEEAAAQSIKLDVRLVSLDPSEVLTELRSILQDNRPNAIVLVGLDHAPMIQHICDENLPAVIINGMDRTMRLSSVMPDNWSAGWLATQQLLAAGHRNIIHVCSRSRLTLQRRFEGFREAMREAGIAYDDNKHLFDLDAYGVDETGTQAVISKAIENNRFNETTAFFCSTDMIALGVMQALELKGFSVPKNYSVIGIDDITISQHARPPLTTMQINKSDLGRIGIRLLVEHLENPEGSVRRICTAVHLIKRASIASR